MTEKKARLYTILIKVAIIVVATAFLVLFIYQYSQIISLQNQKDALNSELTTLTEYDKNLQEEIKSIQDSENEENPNQEYVINTAHGNGYVLEDETYIKGSNT